MKGINNLPFRLYEADEVIDNDREKETENAREVEFPIRIPYWRFLVHYSKINIFETEQVLVRAFEKTGLNADATKRRFFKVVEEMPKCRSSYILETLIVESIKEDTISKEQYDLLFENINKEIRKIRPEKKLAGWLDDDWMD